MAASFGQSPAWVFGAFSAGLLLSALLGPAAGRAVDRHGGRPVLAGSSLLFAAGLALLAAAPGLPVLGLGWAVLGAAMAFGLYETAFAALAGLFGAAARRPITGITLIAGFASTVGWPVSTLLLDTLGWRGACGGWAVLHLLLGLPLHLFGVPPTPPPARTAVPDAPAVPRRDLVLLTLAFAATGIVGSALAAHLPRLLTLSGASLPEAVAAAALVGPAQVAARVAELALFRRARPLSTGRLACALHPVGAVVLLLGGAPGAAVFTVLHGVGAGMLTIVRGTLPLALFGPAGYGLRAGLLATPMRLGQAAAPFCFAAVIEAWGLHALWLTAALSLGGLLALSLLRTRG